MFQAKSHSELDITIPILHMQKLRPRKENDRKPHNKKMTRQNFGIPGHSLAWNHYPM
jgi:hypothetical protein